MLGLQNEPPATLTIVSGRRRRNRALGSFQLTFVYHGSASADYTQIIVFMGKRLRVSTIEKTLVDLTKDCAYSPGFEAIGKLFCETSYDIRSLINIARQASDSVLKRVSLYLAWSGRARYSELPLKLFKRTPVKLDPAIEKNLIWNNLFFCRLPASLLRLPPAPPPNNVNTETRLWMQLRALDEFCEKQALSGMIFIRESPEPRIKAIIENYFIEIFKNISNEKLEWLLANSFRSDNDIDIPYLIPKLLITFITTHTDVLNFRKEEVMIWIEKNIASNDLEKAEAAIFIAILAGYDDSAVIARFEQISSALFYGGHFSIIIFFAKTFLHRNIKLSHNVYLDISKTYSARERYDEALQMLEEAKYRHEDENDGVPGQLYYATALVLKRLNRADEALSELFLARETFLFKKDLDSLARTENALGNIYFSRGRPDSARTHYMEGLHLARQAGNRGLMTSFLSNLGLVEYDFGNFSKAKVLLARAYNLNKLQKNFWNASVTGMSLGKLYLKLGHFFKAIKIFRELLLMREEKKNPSGIYEIYCLLAWICELIGKTATARTYWANAEQLTKQLPMEVRAAYVGESLQCVNHIFNNRFIDAENLYRKMYNEAIATNASSSQTGGCQYGLATALLLQKRYAEAFEQLTGARKSFAYKSVRVQNLLVDIVSCLYFPDFFTDLNLGSLLEKFLATKSFDPFWGHFAVKLMETGNAEAVEYLKFQISRTPPSMLKLLLQRHEGLEQIVEQLQQHSRAGDFFTILSRNETRTMHRDEYLAWQKTISPHELVFDAPAGLICHGANSAKIKPGSIPHSVLLQLFIAQPHEVEVESLYQSAWGMPYDPEFDQGAFKSTIQRLKLILNSISPSTRIVRKKDPTNLKAIKLSIALPWSLAFK
ncbi:MAG: tetratricopeptide repeat protein [Candidatus Riflebacteria bacterium]|nr:tetratricopeptide repeat protein [Candidatus Riflebacteria bacterium]